MARDDGHELLVSRFVRDPYFKTPALEFEFGEGRPRDVPTASTPDIARIQPDQRECEVAAGYDEQRTRQRPRLAPGEMVRGQHDDRRDVVEKTPNA